MEKTNERATHWILLLLTMVKTTSWDIEKTDNEEKRSEHE